MAERALGRSGLTVSPLAFGGNVFGWTADEATSFEVLDAYLDGVAGTLNVVARVGEGARHSGVTGRLPASLPFRRWTPDGEREGRGGRAGPAALCRSR